MKLNFILPNQELTKHDNIFSKPWDPCIQAWKINHQNHYQIKEILKDQIVKTYRKKNVQLNNTSPHNLLWKTEHL